MGISRSVAALAASLLLVACAAESPPVVPSRPQTPPQVPPPPAPTATDTPPPAPSPTLSTADAAKLALPGYFEALSQHDAKRYAGFFTEDGVLTTPGGPPAKGRAEITAAVQKTFDAFSSLKVAPTRVLLKGDVVVAEWALTGTHSGDYLGVKPTEKPVGVVGVTVLVFEPGTGLVKEAHRYSDQGTLLSQIGASKTKARAIPLLSSSPEWKVASGTPAEERAEAVWRRVLAAIEAKNETDYIALHEDDVAYDDLTQPVGMRGQTDARRWLKEFGVQVPDAKVEATGVWGVDDYVVSELILRGTHAASKKPIVLHSVDVVQMKDGKVARGFSYGDKQELTAQVTPAPAAKAPATPAPASKKK